MKNNDKKQLSKRTIADRRAAHAMVAEVARQIGRPMPLGNGTNGPWAHIPVLSPNGYIGVLDIARGVIVLSDVPATRAVLRITDGPSSVSVHEAGGSGDLPAGWRRIVAYYHTGMMGPYRRPVSARVTQVIWGLLTCYGQAGSIPWGESEGAGWWRGIAKPDEAPYVEVEATWSGSRYYPSGVQVNTFFRSLGHNLAGPGERCQGASTMSHHRVGLDGYGYIPFRVEGGHMSHVVGGKEIDREVRVSFFGSRALRESALAAIDEQYQAWARKQFLAEARCLGERLGLCMGARANGAHADEETDRLKLIAVLEATITCMTGKVALR